MKPLRHLRIKLLLKFHLDRLGSMIALERAINAAAKRERAIDRRKLTRLLFTAEDVHLRLSELEAIEDFLTLNGQSLSVLSLYVLPELLAVLAATKQVHFLVGVRNIDGNLSLSYNDAEAYGDITRSLNRPSPGVATVLDVVLMDPRPRDPGNPMVWPWEQTLLEAPAVVVVASPLSNLATHRVLELMLGTFEPPSPFGGLPRPPFAFVIPPEHAELVCSSFVLRPAHLDAKHARLASTIRGRSWGLLVDDRLLVSNDEKQDPATGQTKLSNTYGVILAQRRANGRVLVVVAGLHGAGTHAAALALEKAEINLDSGRPDEDGPVHVRVVEAQVSTTSLNGALLSRVVSQRVLRDFKKTSFPPAGDVPPRKEPRSARAFSHS